MGNRTKGLIDTISRAARPLDGAGRDEFRAVLDEIGDARFVLLGEATHGTSEFYRARAEITKSLVLEKGFRAVAVEADWPDAIRVNRYLLGDADASSPAEALESFTRFPYWMWRNTEVADFVQWLRAYNDVDCPRGQRIGFFGLDLSASTSGFDFEETYEHERRYAEPRSAAWQRRALDGVVPSEDFFFMEQYARVRRNASRYFEAVQSGCPSSWNLRDRHMAETLEAIAGHFDSETGQATKVVVWEHNSHVGDARATQMGAAGDLSLGQILRERHGDAVALVGFTTHHGTVTAASSWGSEPETKDIRPAHPESYEALFHETGLESFLLPLRDRSACGLEEPRLERAIGAVYRPEAELENHYFRSDLRKQFDVVIHFDETHAVTPLETSQEEKRSLA